MRIDVKLTKLRYKIAILWLTYILAPIRKRRAKRAAKILFKSRHWNQYYYDEVIKGMYLGVKEKEALLVKERIIDTRKGGQHVKLLMIIPPGKDEIEIVLTKQEYPELFEASKRIKSKLKAI